MLDVNLRGMISRVAMKTSTWRSETNSGNSESLNWLMYLAKALKSWTRMSKGKERNKVTCMLDSRSRFSTGKGFLPAGRVWKVWSGWKRNQIHKNTKEVFTVTDNNLKRSCDRDIDEQVLYWQRSSDLLDLVPVLVLLHEEHVRDVLSLARLHNVSKLRSILRSENHVIGCKDTMCGGSFQYLCGNNDFVIDQGHALVWNLHENWLQINFKIFSTSTTSPGTPPSPPPSPCCQWCRRSRTWTQTPPPQSVIRCENVFGLARQFKVPACKDWGACSGSGRQW